jgi:hypothetical protein
MTAGSGAINAAGMNYDDKAIEGFSNGSGGLEVSRHIFAFAFGAD